MAWDKGFDFRSTQVFVTDPTNCTYVLAEATPQTRNGATFQWDVVPGKLNSNAGFDARIAGENEQNNTGTQRTWTLTLPSAGQ